MSITTDAIGRVLGGRYRLVAAIGLGASAQVFRAEDVSLGRQVAVKLLQPALASDRRFLKRFVAEARSAAALNHPHIARVFDWGEDEGGPYLVLELLSGGSLLDIFERGQRLSVAQVTSVMAQAARGLAHAHARGLVHRDVKPANLLFDEEGRVRVADFGVARALAEGAWTEPVGATVGTARYGAPEQAQGLALDGRADVYSLALVCFEALTGYVPFVLDTAMGTLSARIGAVLPDHGGLGALAPILRRAAAGDRELRPDAANLARQLETLAEALARPEPLPLAAPQRPTAGPPTLAGLPTQITSPQTGAEHAALIGPSGPASGSGEVFDAEALDSKARAGVHAPGKRRWPIVLAVVTVVLALIAGALVAALAKGVFTPSHPVPRLTAMTLSTARRSVAADHFSVSTSERVASISVGAGRIVSQDPRPGARLKQGSTVNVVVSTGLPVERVPSLTGLGCAGATRLLAVSHLKAACPPAAAGYSDSVQVGEIINWSYDNKLNATRAPYGGTVLIALSKGPAPRTIPSVAGGTFAQAQTALQALGFTVVESSTSSTNYPAGQVDHTSPAIGTQAQPGSTVTVYVSTGPPTVQVPNVSSDSVSQAETTLAKDGLKLGNVYGPDHGTVFATVPEPGTTVNDGTAVNLYTS
ncbi:MAG: protein kinase domain-containing protein [Acidimicrobiales bacterium]